MTVNRFRLYAEIEAERIRQDEKWGEQNHPSVGSDPFEPDNADRICDYHEVPTETRAKYLCDSRHAHGVGTWADILVEEVVEVVAAPNDASRRKELIEVAAVCLAWAECLDRRT